MRLAAAQPVVSGKPVIAAGLGLLLALSLSSPSSAADRRVKALPQKHQEWLELVDLILPKEEREAFLGLQEDYLRERFIEAFWKARDPNPGTEENEFQRQLMIRREEAIERFGDLQDDRARIFTLRGEPDHTFETGCGLMTWPLEFWEYGPALVDSQYATRQLAVLFYQRYGGGPFRIWRPGDGWDILLAFWSLDPWKRVREVGELRQEREASHFYELVRKYCAELMVHVNKLIAVMDQVEREGQSGAVRAEAPPRPRDPEWLSSFVDGSAGLPSAAPELAGTLAFRFPGRHQSRVIVEGLVAIPSADLLLVRGGGRRAFNFLLTGDVLRAGDLFESFRYEFNLPARESVPDELTLVFERHLRPGDYEVVAKVENLDDGGVLHLRQALEVPILDSDAASAEPLSMEADEPEEDEEDEIATIELVSHDTDLRSGLTRFVAVARGRTVRRVTFLLDGKPLLTKTRPPYSVELDLGSIPTSHTVRAVAWDSAGNELATDQIVLNPGHYAFVLKLVEPRAGRTYESRLRARAQVDLPQGRELDRVEFYLNDTRVATLRQPPFVQPILLPDSGRLAYVRAVGYLDDGRSAEDLVVINAPDFSEQIAVQLVEVHATVLDAANRPVLDLAREDFRVLENGVDQEILRFERLDDLPMHAGLLLDTSASMADSLDTVRRAALGFLADTIGPSDRASIVTFSDQPRLAAAFTNDGETLAQALDGLRAERTTKLYDGIVFALYQFNGLRGQKVLLVLTDGQDRGSDYSLTSALRFAQSTGVTIYTIGLNLSKASLAVRGRLAKLADETGGRRYLIDSSDELSAIYEAIQRDLRSRYLLTFQPADPSNKEFRAVSVRVARAGHEVRAPRGYFP